MGQCRRLNAEPALQELLSDPICRLVLARDGLKFEDVLAEMPLTQQRLYDGATVFQWLDRNAVPRQKCAVPATPIGP